MNVTTAADPSFGGNVRLNDVSPDGYNVQGLRPECLSSVSDLRARRICTRQLQTSNSCISTPIENWTHIYMNIFTRNSPYYHLLKYLLFLLKHLVYTDKFQNICELLLGIFVVYNPNKLIPKTMYGTPLYKIFLEKLIVNLRTSYPLHACYRLSLN